MKVVDNASILSVWCNWFDVKCNKQQICDDPICPFVSKTKI